MPKRLVRMVAVAVALCITLAATPTRAHARTVSYHGYRVTVPAAWPVYDLAADPSVCVRFDRHALYLGTPATEERCPAHAVGRTEAILVQPADGSGRSRPSPVAALPDITVRGAAPGNTSAAELALTRRHLLITATWGAHPGVVARAIGVRALHAAFSGPAPPAPPAPRSRADRVAASAASAFSGLGFDACHAPSPAQMTAWQSSPYRAIGVYIGGANAACLGGNLNAGWVSAESAAGWHLIPTYVGLQATGACDCAAISGDPGTASTQGAAAAQDAINDASAVGIGTGNPIYDDLESYSRTAAHTQSVLAFLSGWTATLHGAGYLSGVYVGGNSGLVDLVGQYGTGYREPDDVWFARWPGNSGTTDPNLPAGYWSDHQRMHQYSGGHDATYGGVTINIDGDYVDAATAGASGNVASSPFPDGTFVQVAGEPQTFRIAGGAPLFVNDQALAGASPVQQITQDQFDALAAVPASGTFLETTTGLFYRVVGGAPLYVSDWSLFGGIQPAVVIDEWDLDHIADPLAHLASVPADGTFLTTTSGQSYRMAGGAPFRVSTWSPFGGVQPSVVVDQWNLDNLGNPASHLLPRPVDGTVVKGLPSGWYWSFNGGYRGLSTPSPAAVAVDDWAIPAFPTLFPVAGPACVVPSLRHLTFASASRAIRRALCTLGRVRRPRHWRPSHRLRVYRQVPGAAKTYPEGHLIGIKMR